jgi:hypothetical protein
MAPGKKKKKKGLAWRAQLIMIFVLLAAIAAMPTTVLLCIGMLPTLVAWFIDRTKERTRALTVGAMNAAGCTPFILQLWMSSNTLQNSLMIITDPRTVIVMYCAAGVGYLIDWAISGLVGSVMVQRATSRRDQIAKRKAALAERWGPEVTGDIPLDQYGFPIDESARNDRPAPKKTRN